MSEEKKNINSERHDPVLDTHDATLAPNGNPTTPKPKPDLKPKQNAKPSTTERWKTHRFWIVRASYYALHSVWAIVMAIGAIIAWIIAMLFI